MFEIVRENKVRGVLFLYLPLPLLPSSLLLLTLYRGITLEASIPLRLAAGSCCFREGEEDDDVVDEWLYRFFFYHKANISPRSL